MRGWVIGCLGRVGLGCSRVAFPPVDLAGGGALSARQNRPTWHPPGAKRKPIGRILHDNHTSNGTNHEPAVLLAAPLVPPRPWDRRLLCGNLSVDDRAGKLAALPPLGAF